MKIPFRALLLALLAAVAALAALTLSAAAQTPGGEAGPGESSSTETAQGRIIARVQDQTGEDGVDNYRIEFGFFPEWALDEADPWSAAITSRSDWLPGSRFLTKSRIDARAAANDRSWLRSSLITVPAQSAQSPGDSTQITGRVIARYNPDSEGRLRDQFGFGSLRLEFLFVPEWAFTDTSSTEEAVERLGADGLPSARYLSVATIDARRDVWLRSSTVNVPLRAPVVVIEQPQAPVIDSVSCAPSAPTVDESVTCAATLSGGAPASYAWSGGASNGSAATYITSFSTAGSKTISLTVANTAGNDTESTTLSVAEPLQPPAIDSISCAPSFPVVDDDVTCTANLSGGAPDSWTWSGGGSGDGETHTTSFSEAGEHTISLTVTNSAGSDTESTTLTITEPLQPPAIDSISCAPSFPVVDDDVTCTANLSGDAPDSWTWSGGSDNGDGDSYTTSFNDAGEHTVSLTVTNSAGSDTESTTVSVEEALQAPLIDGINCIPSSPAAGEEITCIAGLSGGAPQSYEWRVGSSSGSGETHTTSFGKAGEYAVSLTVSNSAGSDNASTTVDVGPGLAPPEIDSITCPPSAEVDENITCTVSLSGGTPDTYSWVGGDSNGRDERYRTSFSSPGTKTVWLTVRNSAGRDSDSTTVGVGPGIEQPDVTISCSPSSIDEGESVTCSVTRNRGGPIDNYDWSARGGSPSSGSGSTYSPTFRSEGSYTVRLTVRNSAGRDSDSTTVGVGPGIEQPDVTISCSPSSIDEGESVTCSVTRNRGGPIDNYDWSARGGSPSSGSSSTYSPRFSSEGEYTVSLTASNSAGDDDTKSASVTVRRGVRPPDPSISCTARVLQGDRASCRVDRNRGGDIDRYSWSATGGASSGSSSTYRPRFSEYGRQTVRLTASNDGGSGSSSLPVDVVAATSYNYARCGSDTIRVYWFNFTNLTNLTKHWLNMTWEEVGRRVPRWGEHMIGRLSDDRCRSWPNGRVITDDTWDEWLTNRRAPQR